MAAFKLALLIVVLLVVDIAYDWTVLDKLILALGLLLVVSWCWSRVSLHRLGLRRSLSSDRVRAGEVVEEELQLFNHSRIPKLWIEVHDHSTLPCHRADVVVSVGGNGTSTWRVRTRVARRGSYRLGPFTVHGGDPFGIFAKQRLIPLSHELVAYPALIDVSEVPLPVTTVAGGSTNHGKMAMSSPAISGIRDYSPGDPLNRISWSATARRGSMMVKELDPDPTADIWLILDLSERGNFKLAAPAERMGKVHLDTTVEYIVSIGGSLAERALHEGRKVGVVVNRSMPIRLEADNSERQWFRILEVLASAHAFGNRSLVEALSSDTRRFSRSNGVVVITSHPDASWVSAARTLADRQVAVSAVIVDAGRQDLDDVGPLVEGLASSRIVVTRYATGAAPLKFVEPLRHLAT